MWLLAGTLAAWPLNTLCYGLSPAAVNLICLALLAGFASGALLLRRRGAVNLALAGGFVLGLIFVVKLPHTFSWHDLASYDPHLGGPGSPDGHLGYIAWMVENSSLPMMNPMEEGLSILYHPPLYHIIQTLFMKLNLLIGIPQDAAVENLQLITLACAAACPMVTVDLMRFLGVRERGVRTGTLFMVFQPLILLLGATLNNDILSILMVECCLLFTVRWHHTRKMSDIVGSGVTLGLGMAAKASAALIIPSVAVVFAWDFLRDLKNWKRYIKPFAVFLCVSVPEAVAWPLFHLIAYGMPLNFVRLPAETINVSRYTLWQRFGIPGKEAIRGLFYSPTRSINHNVWMQTLKTGMFDELTLYEKGTAMWYVSYLGMVLFAALLLTALVFFIRMLIRERGRFDGVTKVFLGSYAAIIMGNYIIFCLQYPYICSFNFRYILPVVMLCALALGLAAQEKKSAWLRWMVSGFGTMVILIYGVYFLTK